MAQYSPDPWSCNSETVSGKRSLSSVLRNVQQRKRHERQRTEQTRSRVQERVNENITTSCSRVTYNRRPTKHRTVISATTRIRAHSPTPSPPPSLQQHRRLDKGLIGQPSRIGSISGTRPDAGRGDPKNRRRRQEGSRSRDQSTGGRREVVSCDQQDKASGAAISSGTKTQHGATQHSPSAPRASHQIDQRKQPPQHPTCAPVSRKRAWMYATVRTPESDDDEESEDNGGRTADKPAREPDSGYEQDPPATACRISKTPPETAQLCSSASSSSSSSSSSSGTDTTGSSSSAEESESERCEEQPVLHKPPSQRQRTPRGVSTVPHKAASVRRSPSEAKRLQHPGDIAARAPSAAADKVAKTPLRQGPANGADKKYKTVSVVSNERTATASAGEKKTASGKKMCGKPALSASSAPKQHKSSNLHRKTPGQHSKPSDFKTQAGRVSSRKKQPGTSAKQRSAALQGCTAEHSESSVGEETSHPCALLRDMCSELNELPVPSSKRPATDAVETVEACASITCLDETWSAISELQEVWEDMRNPLDMTAPLIGITTDSMYNDHKPKLHEHPSCEPDGCSDKRQKNECETPQPQMTLDSLCEQSVVDIELLLNPDPNPSQTPTATARVTQQCPRPMSPQVPHHRYIPQPAGREAQLNVHR